MRPAAQVQTAIEILDTIIESAQSGGPAASTLIARAMQQRRYAGSKDRRAIRELIYAAMRAVPDSPASGRAAMLALATIEGHGHLLACFDGTAYGPRTIGSNEREGQVAVLGVVPGWLKGALDPLMDEEECAALMTRAPVDARINPSRAAMSAISRAFPEAQAIEGLPWGVRFAPETAAVQHVLYAAGGFEIQDAASQFAANSTDIVPGMTVIDLCAGSGGKALALAAATGENGRIIACDIDRARLRKLPPRAERAGMNNIAVHLLDPERELDGLAEWLGKAERVFVDVPCSGSGTWRRNPELRWRLTPARLRRQQSEQARLLQIAARLTAPGGKILYAVCSLLAGEGREQVDSFLKTNRDWVAEKQFLPTGIGRAAGDAYLLTPAHDRTDGFFLARMRAPC